MREREKEREREREKFNDKINEPRSGYNNECNLRCKSPRGTQFINSLFTQIYIYILTEVSGHLADTQSVLRRPGSVVRTA